MTARQSLRDATRALHDRVETAVDLPARANTMDGYRGLLRAMLGLFAPIEDRLAALPWARAGLDLDAHRRAPLLRADLRQFAGDADPARPCTDLPAPATLAAGFGCLYVLEGSALGGQIIAREAAASLGLGPETTRFFRSDGREVGRTWRAFGAALDGYVTTPERLDEATAAASQTFEAFERCVARPVSASLSSPTPS